MTLMLKRVYDEPAPEDGYRILVDRLWPRGLTKEKARIDEWAKDITPSSELRVAAHSGSLSWSEFTKSYRRELKEQESMLREILKRAKRSRVTLVYGAKDAVQNHAVVLFEYMKSLR